MRICRKRVANLNFFPPALRSKARNLYYDSLYALGFKKAACLQFGEKLQFKHTYAELSESKASLELNAFPDFSRAVKISALLQNSWTSIWKASPTCKAVLLLCQ